MKLLIVIPVYNEEKSIKKVLTEWIFQLNQFNFYYNILVINDGSTDQTKKILKDLNDKKIKIINNRNIGHGKSCVCGYKYSIKKTFTHVLQIDSDGQCDPKFFFSLYKNINKFPVIYGYRKIRDDGILRKYFSRIMEIFIFFKTFKFIKDPNTPYRLIETKILKETLKKVPKNIILANAYLTFEIYKKYKIFYVPIRFRKRYFGRSKYNLQSMFKSFANLLINLK